MYLILDDRGKTVHTVNTIEEAHDWISVNESMLLLPEALYRIKKRKEVKHVLSS